MYKRQLLLKAGADINEKDFNDNTPLINAILLERDAVVNMLLDAGAGIDIADANNQSPLMIATQLGRLHYVEALLKRQADVQQRDKQDSTILYWAIYEGHDDIARLLIRNGTNLFRLTNGYTPFTGRK